MTIIGTPAGMSKAAEQGALSGLLPVLDVDAIRHLSNRHALNECVTIDDLKAWVRERKLLAAAVAVDGERVATVTFNVSADRKSFLVWAMGGERGKDAVEHSLAAALMLAERAGCSRLVAWCRPAVAKRMRELVAGAEQTGARPGAVRLEAAI